MDPKLNLQKRGEGHVICRGEEEGGERGGEKDSNFQKWGLLVCYIGREGRQKENEAMTPTRRSTGAKKETNGKR